MNTRQVKKKKKKLEKKKENVGNVKSLLPTLPNVKIFRMKTGKLEVFISMTLMSALTNKNDDQFPAKLNTAHGEVAHMQIDCR